MRITKIEYSGGQFIVPSGLAKKGYNKEWEKDMPQDYIFDTYYLEMEKDEVLTHMVTYEVTDSAGNTTVEQIPVKVKYNHYPEIGAQDIYYYFKEDANKGLITEQEILSNAEAFDLEDKEKIKDKLCLVGFDPQLLKMQTEPRAEFAITYEVTDAFYKTSYREVTVVIADADALQAEMPITYVRYISNKYLDTLEPTSI